MTQRRVALAQILIVNLRDRSISKSVRDLADKLLEKLLRSSNDLLWQPDLLSSLLTALDALDATGHPIDVDFRISSWLRKVILSPSAIAGRRLSSQASVSLTSLSMVQALFKHCKEEPNAMIVERRLLWYPLLMV